MSSVTTSNVYYLPVRSEAPENGLGRERRSTLAVRLRRAWWRLRFGGAEIWLIVRRTGRHLFAESEAIRHPRWDATECVRPVGPARVISFVEARARLRPASN